MFTPEELRSMVDEAQSSVPQSVSMSPESLSLDPATKEKLRVLLIGIFKLAFTTFTGVPLPVQNKPQP